MFAEFLRKITHLSGLFLPILYILFDRSIMLVVGGSLVGIAIGVELAKRIFPTFSNYFFHYLKPLLRSHEKQGAITGATFYIISVFLCILIFDKPIAITCIFFITLGDTAAALVGKRWGRTKLIGNKSLEGSAACFVVCLLITVFSINPIVGIMGAFFATLTELLPLRIDDNLTVPLISGGVMQLIVSNFSL